MPKRTRQPSGSPASSTKRQRSQRAKSVFRGDMDPYFPPSNGGQSSLGTTADWQFRLKVLRSEDPVNDGIWKGAVQGLVKMCFPEGILDDLGMKVVAQHMKEEEASEENITRMTEAFRSEMVHRVSWMLANYLDTPEKAERGIASVVLATNRLHGSKLDVAAVDQIIHAFQTLRKEMVEDSQALSQGFGLAKPALDPAASEAAVPSREQSRDVPQEPDEDHAGTEDVNATSASQDKTPSRKKARVSKTWRWDIDASRFTADMVPLYFQRRTDLFAYHALPVVRNELGPDASKDNIRQKMDEILADMATDERKKWQDSFVKLQGGVMEMLNRVEVSQDSDDTEASPMLSTVARTRNNRKDGPDHMKRSGTIPGTEQEDDNAHAGEFQREGRQIPHGRFREASVHIKVEQPIGNESDADVEEPLGSRHGNGATDAAGSLRRLSPEKPCQIQRHGYRGLHHTPIIDLLWGCNVVQFTERNQFVKRLMHALNGRINKQEITLPFFSLEPTRQTKTELEVLICGAFGSTQISKASDCTKARAGIEDSLEPWVATNLSSFPELVAEPFVFAYMLPNSTPLTDLCCTSRVSMDSNDPLNLEEIVLQFTRSRKLILNPKCGIFRIKGCLHAIMTGEGDDDLKRGRLERFLRQLALFHKSCFPELKHFFLVKEWERITGLVW